MLDANDRPMSGLQASGLPLVLKRSRSEHGGNENLESDDTALAIVHMRQGVFAAIPAESCQVRFNGGPYTKLPHEFDSWVLIDIQGSRFRVSNAGFRSKSPSLGVDSAVGRPRWRVFVDFVRSSVLRIRRPGLMALGAMLGLVLIALADWLAETGRVTYWTILMRQQGRLTDLLVWWAGWSALSWQITGQLVWLKHLRIVALATMVYGAAKLFVPPAFAAVGLVLPEIIRTNGWLILAALVGWSHVAAVPAKQSVRRALGMSVGAVLALMIVSSVIAHLDDEADSVPAFAATLPVGIDQSRETPLEQVLEEVAALQTAADRARLDPFR